MRIIVFDTEDKHMFNELLTQDTRGPHDDDEKLYAQPIALRLAA
jgi:hypothetical protein